MSGGGIVVSFVGEQDSAASVGDGVEHNNPGSGDLVYDLIWAVVWLLRGCFTEPRLTITCMQVSKYLLTNVACCES